MFKKTSPQMKLFGVATALPEGMRSRLKASWAEVFRTEILPILMKHEEGFAILYGTVGRPNFSVGRMLALCLLQELYDFSDQEALDAFGFDARWQYATDIHIEEEAYLSRRSLVEFRSRLAKQDPQMALLRKVFETISERAIGKLGLSVREQRLDSTHVASNIHTHGRIDLFQSTLKLFVRSLNSEQYSRLPKAIRRWVEEETNGWFGLGSKEQKKEKLQRLASFLHKLILLFKEDKEVNSTAEYGLLVQLFSEHCELKTLLQGDTPHTETDAVTDPIKVDVDENAEAAKTEAEIIIKKNKSGETLQSPHDPDATYGHKGVGYSAQIVETCNNAGKTEIITGFEVHGAARSDVGKAPEVLEQLENTTRKPEVLYADGGYPTVSSVPEMQARNIELVAPVNRGPMSVATMGRDRFVFDNLGRVVQCPAGHHPVDHRELSNGTVCSLHAVFNGDICRKCYLLEQCPVRGPNHRIAGCSLRNTHGNFRLEITAALLMRDEMFAKQQTLEWKERYKIRSGIEATMSELKRKHGLGNLRVRGLARVRLAVVCKLIACNFRRWAKAQIASNGGFNAGPGPLRWSPNVLLNAIRLLLTPCGPIDVNSQFLDNSQLFAA